MMNNILDKYLSSEEKNEFLNIVGNILNHEEFKRRDTNEFLHHSNITLATHILEVACLTYKKSKKIMKKNSKYRLDLALKIAMLHDLYTLPWQNNDKNTKTKFFNKHGFRHPIEAVINSIVWFPNIYKDEEDAMIIIDGIIHHMYPLAVRKVKKDIKYLELNNYKLYSIIDDKYKNMIIKSTNRIKIINISICRSKYKEGKVVSLCDKKVSMGQIKNVRSLLALITGRNKTIN